MSKATILNQLRKLEVVLADIHDISNYRSGPSDELTKRLSWAYARCFSILSDVESAFDEQDLSEDD